MIDVARSESDPRVPKKRFLGALCTLALTSVLVAPAASFASQEGGLPALAAQVEAVQSTVAGLQATVNGLQTEVTNLDGKLQGQITTIQSALKNLQDRITGLQNALKQESVSTACVPGDDAAQLSVCSNGVCRTSKFSCFPYQCDANVQTCATECSTSDDCATGFGCKLGACVAQPAASCIVSPPELCPPNSTFGCNNSINNLTGEVQQCGPYSCDSSSGLCLKLCGTADDCNPGYACRHETHSCEGV